MDEKVLAKGKFSKFNIISLLFLLFGIVGFSALCTGVICADDDSLMFGVAYMIVGFVGMAFFHYLFDKCDITITNKRVYGKAAFGRRVDLPFDKISSVDTCIFKGIGVATSSGRIKFLLCKNRDEVFEAISNFQD